MADRTSAELVIIGSEILLGESLDTNTRVIALALRENGIPLTRTVTVADRAEDIVAAVQAAAGRAGAVITTGGLGPTVDDPTRASIAAAAGVALEFQPALWEAITARLMRLKRQPTENNRRQAFIPAGGEALPNPYGTAPGFAVRIGEALLCALPGVPAEMRPMLMEQALPRIRAHLGVRQVLRSRTLLAAGLTESQIDDKVGRFEEQENPVVGLAAYPGQTRIRITARGAEGAAAEALLRQTEAEIRALLGDAIFGVDNDTLAGAALRALPAGSALASLEAGTGGSLAAALSAEQDPGYAGGLVLPGAPEADSALEDSLAGWMAQRKADSGLAAVLRKQTAGFESVILIRFGGETRRSERTFAVAGEAAAQWIAANAFALLRDRLAVR